MRESPPAVGYGRPPEHTRFQKGQSGNPGGKPGPKRRLKYAFDRALDSALDADRQDLKDARPQRVIDALARKVALDALEGRASAQRLVLGVLAEDGGGEARLEAEGVDDGDTGEPAQGGYEDDAIPEGNRGGIRR